MDKINITVSNPTYPKAKKLTKEDVWGEYSHEDGKRISSGMIVARQNEKCPIFKDIIPFKSETIVCHKDQSEEVSYWIEYVNGADSISEIKELDDDKLAFRCEYMCW